MGSIYNSPFDTVLYSSPLLTVGKFRADPAHPGFRDSGPVEEHCFVFPRTAVRIQHAGRKPFLADPNFVTFYNRDQVYWRDRVTAEGDRCEWFSLEQGTLLEILSTYHPVAADRPDRPFAFTHGPGDPRSYLLQRLVVRHLSGTERVDRLFVEETALGIFARVAASAARAHGLAPEIVRETDVRHAGLAEAAKTVLARRFREPLSLEDIARQTASSMFHLSRVFRRHTGQTLHDYQNRLRLLTALEAVARADTDLTDLALDLGYSSHSHFTAAFRRTFGTAPSSLRQGSTARRVRELAERVRP